MLIEYKFKFDKDGFTLTKRVEPPEENTPDGSSINVGTTPITLIGPFIICCPPSGSKNKDIVQFSAIESPPPTP